MLAFIRLNAYSKFYGKNFRCIYLDLVDTRNYTKLYGFFFNHTHTDNFFQLCISLSTEFSTIEWGKSDYFSMHPNISDPIKHSRSSIVSKDRPKPVL